MMNSPRYQSHISDLYEVDRYEFNSHLREELTGVTDMLVESTDAGNWTTFDLELSKDEESEIFECSAEINTTIDKEGVVTGTVTVNHKEFVEPVVIEFNPAMAAAYRNMMIGGQLLDVAVTIEAQSTPELNDNYDPLTIRKLTE